MGEIVFGPQKAQPCRKRRHLTCRIDRENRCRGFSCRLAEERTSRVTWCAFSHIWAGAKGSCHVVMKFCVGLGVFDVITHANVGDDHFRGFWGSRGRISHFSINLRYRP